MNKKVIFIMSAILVLLLLSIYLFTSNRASTQIVDIPTEKGNDTVEVETASIMTRYTVKPGDTVDSIANEFGLSVQTIIWANRLSTNTVRPGQTLDIPPMDGILVTVQEGDTLQSLANEYSVEDQEITDLNWLEYPFDLEVGQELFIPIGKELE